jgi:predicted nucleotidyltransferase
MNDIGTVASLRSYLKTSLWQCDDVHAAALYGSVARGDSEFYSDIDLIIVCDASHKQVVYTELKSLLCTQNKGFSLAIYTPRELYFLASVKSLFLLHLSRECDCLFDRTGLLTQLLATFEPKTSYANDFKDSLGLVAPLRTVVANSPNQLHRLAYIYSLFRVFGVYLLAEHRIFEFSKAKMARALQHLYPERAAEIDLLSSLRILNAHFFSGTETTALSAWEHDEDALRTSIAGLSAIIGTSIDIRRVHYTEAVDDFVKAVGAEKGDRLGYKFRTWFLLLIYDGLNLFCASHKADLLTSFSELPFIHLTDSAFPDAIRGAAYEALDYLHNYPLRYFLLEQSKIPVANACKALNALSKELAS